MADQGGGVVTAVAELNVTYPQRRAMWAVGLVLSASFVAMADGSIVNIAAPAIQRSLHASVADIELTVSGYDLAFGAMLITGGRLGDIFGRRTLFCAGFTGVVLASAACGLAASPGQLIVFRVAQGAAAGLLSPQVLATIQIVLPPSRRPGAFAALSVVLSLAIIAGPLISGLIIVGNFFGTLWRPIFLVNVPIGIIAIAAARWLLPTERNESAVRVDFTGTVLLMALWGALMVPLTLGAHYGWPAWAWGCLAAVPVLAVAFLAAQRSLAAHGRQPILPPALWENRPFRTGIALYLVLYSGVIPFFLYYTFVLQSGYRLSALLAAVSTIPTAAGTLIFSVLSSKLVRRFGTYQIVTAGTLFCAAGFLSVLVPLQMATTGWLAVWTEPSQFVVGAGLGMVIPSVLSLVLVRIRSSAAGAASGLLGSAQAIGGGMGVVVMGLLFQFRLPSALAAASVRQLTSGLELGVLFAVATLVSAMFLLRALPRSGLLDEAAP